MKIQKKKLIPWMTKLPAELKADMMAAAAITDRSVSSFVRIAVKEKIEQMIQEDPKLKGKFKSLAA